jgi:hypothetical protein
MKPYRKYPSAVPWWLPWAVFVAIAIAVIWWAS